MNFFHKYFSLEIWYEIILKMAKIATTDFDLSENDVLLMIFFQTYFNVFIVIKIYETVVIIYVIHC